MEKRNAGEKKEEKKRKKEEKKQKEEEKKLEDSRESSWNVDWLHVETEDALVAEPVRVLLANEREVAVFDAH